MGRQRLATAAAAKAPVHHRAENHGKFQPLALVHRHQPHHVVVLAQQLRAVALAPGAELLRVQQKAGQRTGDALVEGGGVGDQPVQVRLTLGSARQRSGAIVQPAFLQNCAQQHAQLRAQRHELPPVQQLEEGPQAMCQLVRALGIGKRRVHEGRVRLRDANLRQFPGTQANRRGAQHADQLHVAAAVRHQLQQRQRQRNLHGFIEVLGAVGEGGDALLGQDRRHAAQHAPLGAGEHGKVPEPQLRVFAHQGTDATRNEQRLALADLHLEQLLAGLAAVRGLQQVDLHLAAAEAEVSVVQPGVRVVDDLAVAAVHGPLEHPVDEVQNRRAGAEVHRQRQQRAAVSPLVGRVLLQEQPRFGLTEAVDGLLHVAHHEQVVAPGDAGNQRLLHVGGVLILVHEDVIVALPQGPGGVVVPERAQRAVLQIGIAQAGQLRLARLVALPGAQRDLAQAGKLGREQLHVGQRRAQLQSPQGAALDGALGVAAQLLHRLVHRAAVALLPGGSLPEARQRALQFVAGIDPAQLRERLQILLQRSGVVRVAAGVHQRQPGHQQRLIHVLARGAHELVQPALPQFFVRRAGHAQPVLGIGALLQAAQQNLRHGAHALGAACVVQLGQALVGIGIGLLHGLVQSLVQQAAGLRVVQHPERGIHPGALEVGAQKFRAEAVQRGDAGAVHQQLLVAADLVPRRGAPAQFLGELGAHVRGRCAGEGDDQHAVDARLARGDQLQHALHQHGGLAGARRRAEQDVRAPRLDSAPLFIGKMHADPSRISLKIWYHSRARLARAEFHA